MQGTMAESFEPFCKQVNKLVKLNEINESFKEPHFLWKKISLYWRIL